MIQQPMGDLPTFVDAGHQHSIYNMGHMNQAATNVAGTATPTYFGGGGGLGMAAAGIMQQADYRNRRMVLLKETAQTQATPTEDDQMARRIVQVFIADTDENVPLERSVIYTGEQKLTDSTDQELYFEINLKELLDKHNEYRVTLINKKVKERVENLEAAKIRDLKMVVVTIASF